jgi:hypothetical protein
MGAGGILVFNYGRVISLPQIRFYSFGTPPLHRLGQNLTLGHTKEFVHATKALVPLAPTLMSFKDG